MSTMSTALRHDALGTVDAATLSIDAQGIGSAASYPSSVPTNSSNYASIDLGAAISPGKKVWANFMPSDDLAGGTSLQYRIYGSSDNSTFVLVAQSNAIALAGYAPYRMLVPPDCGYRYFQLQVVSLGTHSAGSVTAWLN